MHENDARDSSSNSSEDDASPDNSDVEEDKVVSVCFLARAKQFKSLQMLFCSSLLLLC